MKKLIGLGVVLIAGLVFSSCKKSCIVDETYEGSAIVYENNGKNVIVIPAAGYLTGNYGGNYRIDQNHPYKDYYEVSFDGGMTKQPVDYSKYVIFANPKTVPCNASLHRKVEVGQSIVVYSVSVTNDCAERCADENSTYSLENYILVKKSALPPSYLFKTE